jgi:hypothetical protein
MNPFKSLLSAHKGLRKAQALYRLRKGKMPTTLPWEGGGTDVNKLKGFFVGKDSQKAPITGVIIAAVGLASLLGYNIPGVPLLSQDAAFTSFSTGLATVFLAYRVKKSGPIQ